MMEELYFNVEINNETVRCRNVAEGAMRRATVSEKGQYSVPLSEGDLAVTVDAIPVTEGISRVKTTVKNGGSKPVLVNGVAALYYRGIPVSGEWWKDKSRYSVWVCRNAWQAEGQWDEKSLEELGLYPSYNHQYFSTARLESFGTWTTAYTHPFVILCDKVRNVSYCIDAEFAGPRFLEIGCEIRGDETALYVYLASAHARCGWHKNLKAGEEYTTETAAFGRVEGGFEQAVAAMTEYRRRTSLVTWKTGYAPVCYNDYMNCLWAKPTREKLIPLIDSASEAGCEIFCIDAGWFGNWHDYETGTNGNWVPEDSLFGEGGLQGVLDHIRGKGMIPGLWLELESVLKGAPFFREHPEYLVTRYGVKIKRDFPDFRLAPVRDYFAAQIDALCAMGVGYFKNDYNANLNAGCDSLQGGTLADGAREYVEAFRSFIDETIVRHPDLILENCGSGALRSDNGTLSHFALQSISDQEDYFRLPSIIQGSLAQFPPEKAGVWAYPYALPLSRAKEDPKTGVRCEDAETVFNLAGGLFGCMYLSGHWNLADWQGKERLKEGIDFYKQIRPWTCRASAVYPLGLKQIDERGMFCIGLLSPEDGKMLLGFFSVQADWTVYQTVDLSPYCSASTRIVRIFSDGTSTVTGTLPELSVTFPAGHRAMVLELDL
ncbi:MAG: alpha-galactosidase [Clostridia bacterium]|nr:alpha-galactosidase [Clostridia bacterium]